MTYGAAGANMGRAEFRGGLVAEPEARNGKNRRLHNPPRCGGGP